MKNSIHKHAGISLLTGAFLATVTMALHPVGGSIDHLIKVSPIILTSHIIAIFSVPFILFGFWGLSRRIGFDKSLSVLAFIISAVGLFAVMLAGAINGLALPFFVEGLSDISPEKQDQARFILSYGFSLNQAFDYIFIGALCEAFLCWSFVMLKEKVFPKWVAILGIILGLGFLIALIAGLDLVHLHGFSVFIYGIASWVAAVGLLMVKRN
ncbi:hypothetical protein [Roseivirga misakiensis]|uniref:DUF4386 domain-containing protein n=1 Tax=Roseivirga misakiensis TaxID=1563681 RepID=A0A1E5T5M9_9BACT|nr:hypothetical protein [Roseivirga misakiensis]OEK06648.1 hypothetical protein BFP71_02990 [Roseivirga misakiensis]